MCSTGCCGNGHRSTTRRWSAPATATGYWSFLVPAWFPEPLADPSLMVGFPRRVAVEVTGRGRGFGGLVGRAACRLPTAAAAGCVVVVQVDHNRPVPGL